MVRAGCRCAGEHLRSVCADGALQIVRKAIPVAGLEGDVVNADDVGVACQLQLYLSVPVGDVACQGFGKIEVSVPSGYFKYDGIRFRYGNNVGVCDGCFPARRVCSSLMVAPRKILIGYPSLRVCCSWPDRCQWQVAGVRQGYRRQGRCLCRCSYTAVCSSQTRPP